MLNTCCIQQAHKKNTSAEERGVRLETRQDAREQERWISAAAAGRIYAIKIYAAGRDTALRRYGHMLRYPVTVKKTCKGESYIKIKTKKRERG
jgi:hypothetical protein